MVSRNKAALKKQQKRNHFFLSAAVVVFLLILVSTVFKDWVQIVENKTQTKDLNTYYEELKEEQASLNSEVVKLQDPEYVARYAREKYMYTKEGETILKIIEVPTKGKQNTTE